MRALRNRKGSGPWPPRSRRDCPEKRRRRQAVAYHNAFPMSEAQPEYVLGHASPELDRLIAQARFYGDLTEEIFRRAGVSSGMRVLDVGCGTGDVSFLAARMVGPEGFVLGIDRSPDAVALASARAVEAKLSNVTFEVGDATALSAAEPFDAVVGRLVLMYAPDPSAFLRTMMRHLRAGGLLCFHEFDLATARSVPELPMFTRHIDLLVETFRRSGANVHMASDLYAAFARAGLSPQMIANGRVEAGPESPVYEVAARVALSVLPAIERFGLGSREDLQLDSLAARLRDVATEQNAVLFAPLFVGAWCRVTQAPSVTSSSS